MSDQRDDDRVVLRVDRLAAAMDAARARAARDASEKAGDRSGKAPPTPPRARAADAVADGDTPEATTPADPGDKAAPADPGGVAPDRTDLAQFAPPLSADVMAGDAAGATMPVHDPEDAAPFRHGESSPSADERRAPAGGYHTAPAEPLVLSVDAIVEAPDIAEGAGVRFDPAQPPQTAATQAPPVLARAAPAPEAEPAVLAPQTGPSVLSTRGVCADIGGVAVLDGVDLDVPSGQVTALLGRSGSGKTTTLRAIMGLVRTTAGQIQFAGEQIAGWPPDRIARRGVGYVPASTGIFERLTVSENMRLAARTRRLPQDRVDWVLRTFPALHAVWKTPAGRLSEGPRRMLAIARAVIENRRLYLIDEPTSGLAPEVGETIVGALRDLKLQGATVLLADCDMTVARSLARTCAVMAEGRIVWAGETAALTADASLQARLLGQDAETV